MSNDENLGKRPEEEVQLLASLPPEYRRDIRLERVILNRELLEELFALIESKTVDAKKIQFEFENKEKFESDVALRAEIDRWFRINYTVRDSKDNSISGTDLVDFESESIPDSLSSIYISNSQIFKSATGGRSPTCCVDIYLDFRRSSMAVNFLNLPSNPTDNRSIINVYGFNEDWVISTHQKLVEFFESKKASMGFLHMSGVYDAYLFGLVIPIILWMAYKIEISYTGYLKNQSIVFLVAIYIYGVYLSLISGRILFQYFRWLFPLVEYAPKKRYGPTIHRGIISFVVSGLGVMLLYDILTTVF